MKIYPTNSIHFQVFHWSIKWHQKTLCTQVKIKLKASTSPLFWKSMSESSQEATEDEEIDEVVKSSLAKLSNEKVHNDKDCNFKQHIYSSPSSSLSLEASAGDQRKFLLLIVGVFAALNGLQPEAIQSSQSRHSLRHQSRDYSNSSNLNN